MLKVAASVPLATPTWMAFPADTPTPASRRVKAERDDEKPDALRVGLESHRRKTDFHDGPERRGPGP